jgi:hypothetical protein
MADDHRQIDLTPGAGNGYRARGVRSAAVAAPSRRADMNHRKRGDDICHESLEAVVDTVFGVATEPVAKILDAELSAGIRDRIRAAAVTEFRSEFDDFKWIQKVFARCRGDHVPA